MGAECFKKHFRFIVALLVYHRWTVQYIATLYYFKKIRKMTSADFVMRARPFSSHSRSGILETNYRYLWCKYFLCEFQHIYFISNVFCSNLLNKRNSITIMCPEKFLFRYKSVWNLYHLQNGPYVIWSMRGRVFEGL